MQRKFIIGGVTILVIFLIFLICINVFFTGTNFWMVFTPHKSITISSYEEGKEYNNYYEQLHYEEYVSTSACTGSPGYTQDYLFGGNCKFIFYGTVKACTNYTFEEDGRVYNCHVMTLQVNKQIYGCLRKNQEVNLLLRYYYDEDYEITGKEGIFISNGLPIKLKWEEKKKNIITIGSMRNTKQYHYCLSDEAEGLEELNSKKDVIAFWKEQGWLDTE